VSRSKTSSPHLLVITGLSGSGKTHVSRALEDVGWFCVDNLPSALMGSFAELIGRSPDLRRTALVVDVRERGFPDAFPGAYRGLGSSKVASSLLFLESDDDTLVRRFSETRRPHPLAAGDPAIEGIRAEREALRPIRKMADLILDTSRFTVHQLRDYVRERYDVRTEGGKMLVSVLSFGFKYGVPAEAEHQFDVRFLPNPEWVPKLKRLTGADARVVRYLKDREDFTPFLRRVQSYLAFVLPRHEKEGRTYVTLAVGCTGGRHRSVMFANELGEAIRKKGFEVRVYHRDVKGG
jgi:UPF0042 nucleotide-binding protein